MVPIAFEWAVGLERLSPLTVVAIGGLLVSTVLTMVYVPVVYALFGDAQQTMWRLLARPVTSPGGALGKN
jgi:Cu/Ag efflux pump CusA